MVKEIQLTQGKVALVDDSDYEWLNQWKWYVAPKRGNWCARRSKDCIGMHSLILNTPKGMVSDHVNNNSLDNQRNNLRVCTNSENLANRNSPKGIKSSKFKGVSLRWDRKKWRACIKVRQKFIHLGYFTDELEAAKAYDNAAIKYFGEFAKLNIGGSNE